MTKSKTNEPVILNAEFVIVESSDGYSIHAPGSKDEDIAAGKAPYLVSEPWPSDNPDQWIVPKAAFDRARKAIDACNRSLVMSNNSFSAVDYVRNAVADWTANDGGLTMAAVDIISDARFVDRAYQAGDLKTLYDLLGDDRYLIVEAAQAAIDALGQ